MSTSIYKSGLGEHAVRYRYLQLLKHWPVPSERLRVPTREGETHVIASGPKGAPPLVLLHGASFNSVGWMGDVAAWSERFRVYAVDIIGQAGLSAAKRPRYDSQGYTLWLDDVLNGLSVSAASFVGLSLGGWIALDYGIRRPQRCRSLVLLAPAGIGRERMSAFKLLFVILPLLSMGRWGRRKAMDMILGPRPTSGRGAAAVEDFLSLIAKHFRQNRAKPRRFEDAELAGLAMPILLIVGGRDPVIDSDESKARLERTAKNVTVHYLPEVGHAVLGQTRLILDFLTGHLEA